MPAACGGVNDTELAATRGTTAGHHSFCSLIFSLCFTPFKFSPHCVGIENGFFISASSKYFLASARPLYTDCQGPYTSGSSRHCAPLRAIQSIPLSICLSSFRGRPRCPVLSGGSIAFTRSYCSFVNSYRFMYLFSHYTHLVQYLFFKQTLNFLP